ncbi:MAG TPA: hypothetical protein DCY13_11435 [Verrucomicrobiales bacterium]|nr:hypothetical protein [Verrucomicrobiales bacterium]
MKSGQRISDLLSRLTLFVVVGAGLVGVFGWYVPLIQENQRLQKDIAIQNERIAELRRANQAMTLRWQNFYADSNTVERLARENLGYARPGEIVYRFEAEAPAPSGSTGH